ncbi:MAG: DedA family protein [Myxococcota bacterium]
MEWLLEWGLVGVVGVILLSAVGLPVPEELSLATAGVLAGRGHAALLIAVFVCYAAVLMADLFVWGVGRTLGSSARLRSFVGEQHYTQVSNAYARYGGWLVLMVRPLPGMRVPVYTIAGAAGMPSWRFVLFDGLAAAITVPLYVCAGYWLADDLARLTETIAQSRQVMAGFAALVGAALVGWWFVRVRGRGDAAASK